jgi:hypothetical protein
VTARPATAGTQAERQQYLIVRGILADLPEPSRSNVEALAAEFRDRISKAPATAPLALALVGLEIATGRLPGVSVDV